LDSDIQGRMIGMDGHSIRRCEQDLNVRISLVNQELIIEGPPENVEEARARMRELADGEVS
jgi:rRNA processing protein Krr1/Pno1